MGSLTTLCYRDILRGVEVRPPRILLIQTPCLLAYRDFLFFMPQEASLHTIYSYYLSTISVSPEGDVNLSDELNLLGLGTVFQLSLVPAPIQKLAQVEVPEFILKLFNWPYLSPWWPGLGTLLPQHLLPVFFSSLLTFEVEVTGS